MKEKTDNAILTLIEKAGYATKSEDALRFTQAALNLAHVLAVKNQNK